MPAPSPITKPSRSLSHGRLAVVGSSLRVDSARMVSKPPIPSGQIVDSEPPAIITSASPYSISRPASPIECSPVVHAVTIARFGPLSPYWIDRLPAIMLMIDPGIRNGETRRGPRLSSSLWLSSIIGRPPMPEPITQPMRSRLASVISMPLSLIACTEAAMP